ncbi:Uncharacterised protein [Clostridium paraputrificum]|uniref:Uncharacterized protein n=1 Tax=Clostridium paraputrificum TaxID=29363 RepID=A0A6N3DIQ2_9CLOT
MVKKPWSINERILKNMIKGDKNYDRKRKNDCRRSL